MLRPNLGVLATLDQFWQLSKHEILLFSPNTACCTIEEQSF